MVDPTVVTIGIGFGLATWAVAQSKAVSWDSFVEGNGLVPGWAGRTKTDAFGIRWAGHKDLKPLYTLTPQPGCLLIGKYKKGYLQLPPEHSQLVLGATRSGKTVRLINPNVAAWKGPAVVISTKPDIMAYTAANRPDSFWFSPGEEDEDSPSGVKTIGWSMLDTIRRALEAGDYKLAWQRALQTADAAVSTADMKNVTNGDFWKNSAGMYAAPMVLAAAADPHTNESHLLDWAGSGKLEEAKKILQRPENTQIPKQALRTIAAIEALPPNQRGASLGTLYVALKAYNYPGVLDSATRPDRFDPAWLLDPKGDRRTLYVTATSAIQQSIAPIFNAQIEEILALRYAQADHRIARIGNRNIAAIPADQRLLVAVDEGKNICPLPKLPNYASEGAGRGVNLLVAFQDYGQVVSSQGDNAPSVLSNIHCRHVAPGMADPKTLETFEGLLGSETVDHTSRTSSNGGNSTTTSAQDRKLFPAAALRVLKTGEQIIVYGNLPAIRAKMMDYGEFCVAPQTDVDLDDYVGEDDDDDPDEPQLIWPMPPGMEAEPELIPADPKSDATDETLPTDPTTQWPVWPGASGPSSSETDEPADERGPGTDHPEPATDKDASTPKPPQQPPTQRRPRPGRRPARTRDVDHQPLTHITPPAAPHLRIVHEP